MSIEEEQEKRAPISTICRDCVFATWENKTQTGCQFDRIEKFEDNGAEILGYDDGDKKYFAILGRFCNACRNKEWGKENPRRKWKKIVEDRIKVQVDIIIRVSEKTDLEDLSLTVTKAYSQTPKPVSVVIACDPGYLELPILDIVNYMKTESKGTWRVEQLEFEKAVKPCKGTYYAVFNAGHRIPEDFLERINIALNDKLLRFVALLPDSEGNGLVLQNCGLNLEGIINKAKIFDQEFLITRFEDI